MTMLFPSSKALSLLNTSSASLKWHKKKYSVNLYLKQPSEHGRHSPTHSTYHLLILYQHVQIYISGMLIQGCGTPVACLFRCKVSRPDSFASFHLIFMSLFLVSFPPLLLTWSCLRIRHH